MPFLNVGGTDVSVAGGSVRRRTVKIGDEHRAFDGTLRGTIRSYLREWQGQTTPLDRSSADSLVSTINATTQPVECYGDLIGSSTVDCQTSVENWTPVRASTGHRVVIEFLLKESS